MNYKRKIVFTAVIFISFYTCAQNLKQSENNFSDINSTHYKVSGEMILDKELRKELYKAPREVSYKQKAKTSLIIGLSLLPPALLFSQLAEPKEVYEKYKIGWGAAAFATGSAAIFYLIRSTHFKKKYRKRTQ